MELDRDRRETGGRALVGRAQDDEKEHQRQHHLGPETGLHRIAVRGMFAIPVRRQAVREVVAARRTAGDPVEDPGGENGAQHLGDHVRGQLRETKTAGDGKTQRHGRVEVTARDVADGECHGQHRQTEGQRHAHVPDAEVGDAGRQHGRPAAAEHQPECADELGGGFLR